MPSFPSTNAYNPGRGFIKNPRSFSTIGVVNPAHVGVVRPHDGDDWSTGRLAGVNVPAAANGLVVTVDNHPRWLR